MGKINQRPQVAFVTGASRGIGRAASVALAARGLDVVVAARTVKEGDGRARGSSVRDEREVPVAGSLEDTADRIRALGRRALPVRLDLLDASSIDSAVDTALAEWGRVDVLVNNAIFQGPGLMDRLLDVPLDAFDKILHANIVAQLHLTTRLLPGMVERGGGVVVNLSSGSGQMDPPGPVGQGGWGFAYSSSKAAFHRMVGILHVEHRDDGIRAFNVDPGYTPTESMRALNARSDLDEHYQGAPPEVAGNVIAWLATDDGAAEWDGQLVNSQRLCRQLGLVEGWPPPRRTKG